MASGVKVSDDCKERFSQMKLGHKHQYILYKLSDDLKEIVVQQLGGKGESYESLVEHFRAAEADSQCRYALFDLEYTTLSGTKKNKILFFMWSPDSAKIKQKMVYSASKDALKKALGDGIGKEVQANDEDDLNMDSIVEELQKTDRN